jgi:hypothetical protein
MAEFTRQRINDKLFANPENDDDGKAGGEHGRGIGHRLSLLQEEA